MPQRSVDELFSLDPNEFVAGRDALARELRAEGDKDEAKRVKGLRRPTIPVWALNQVARREPDLVAQLVDAVADAQAATGATVREALARRRDVLRETVRAARAAIERSGRSPDPHEVDLTNTLNTVLGSAAMSDDLRRGELTVVDAESAPALEWPDLTDVEVRSQSSDKDRVPAPTRPSRAAERAREELERRQVAARDAATRVEEAERSLAAAREEVERARQRLAELEDRATGRCDTRG